MPGPSQPGHADHMSPRKEQGMGVGSEQWEQGSERVEGLHYCDETRMAGTPSPPQEAAGSCRAPFLAKTAGLRRGCTD